MRKMRSTQCATDQTSAGSLHCYSKINHRNAGISLVVCSRKANHDGVLWNKRERLLAKCEVWEKAPQTRTTSAQHGRRGGFGTLALRTNVMKTLRALWGTGKAPVVVRDAGSSLHRELSEETRLVGIVPDYFINPDSKRDGLAHHWRSSMQELSGRERILKTSAGRRRRGEMRR